MLKILTPPASEPITLTQAKLQCRVDITDDDALIADLITTGRELCEAAIARSFMTTQWRLSLDGFPNQYRMYGAYRDPRMLERPTGYTVDPIFIPRAPIQTIDALTYLDPTGARVTLDPSLYTFEPGDGALIFPAYGHSWPSAEVTIGSVRVDFTAGYGTDPTLVPASARHAIKLAVAHLYEQREGAAALPPAIRQVLGPASWGYIP